MHRPAPASLALLLALAASLGCDGEEPLPDAGTRTDAGRRTDAGPFVCPNPAWAPTGAPPTPAAPAIDALTIDRDALDTPTVETFDAAAIAEDAATFDLGVQAGAMRETSALLWTHRAGAGDVTLRVWRDGDAAGEVRLVDEQVATPEDGGFVHVSVSDLAPATRYRYAFFLGTSPGFTGRSVIGRFTTAIPAGEVATIRVAATTCTNQATRPFEALSLMAAEDPDVVVQLGDMTYNDSARTVDEYRQRWALNLGDEGYRALLASAGAYFTWDDHELTDSDGYYDQPQSRVDIAHDAFFANLAIEPVDRTIHGATRRTFWGAYPWGDAVDFIVLDSRSERIVDSREGPDARYISEEQLAFLQDRLMNSTARFKVILNSVPIANLPLPPWEFEEDRWQGYAAQRTRLIDFITSNGIEDVVFLTGDFHLGYVARVEPEGAGRSIWEIAVGPGGSRSANPVPALVEGGLVDLQDGFPCEMFDYYSDATDVTTTLDFDPVAGTIHVRFVEALTGEVLYDNVLYNE